MDIPKYLTCISTHVLACLLACSFSSSALADDYLDMLEAEADGSTVDQSTQLVEDQVSSAKKYDDITKKNWRWEGELDDGAIPTGLAQDEFATVLKQLYYGSFVFYRRLNNVDQKEIYNYYARLPRPEIKVIRKAILKRS